MTVGTKIARGEFYVVYMPWEEVEVGWGSRPDGYSLHLTESHRLSFVDDYWAGMPDERPDEYSSPMSEGVTRIGVDEKTGLAVRNSKNGIRIYN